MRLGLQVTAATLIMVAAILFTGVKLGLAAEPCRGQLVRASWYGLESCHPYKRCQTATGAAFNGENWIVASRTLPMNTMLRFTYQGHTVTVPVGDRGPYHRDKSGHYDREIDFSHAVARAIGFDGVGRVCLERLGNSQSFSAFIPF